MTIFFILLQQNLLRAGKNLGRSLQNILFFLISCAIFFMLAQTQPDQASAASQQFLICNIIWFSLLFSLIFANGDFLAEDYRDGTVEQMIIFCPNLEVFILSKIIASFLVFCLPILCAIPFIMVAMGVESGFIWHFLILIALASFAINFVCAFCGSLNIAGNQAPLLAILALPLIIPILLIGCGGSIGAGLEGSDNFYFSLKLLCGICVFVGSTLLVATTKIVKIVSE